MTRLPVSPSRRTGLRVSAISACVALVCGALASLSSAADPQPLTAPSGRPSPPQGTPLRTDDLKADPIRTTTKPTLPAIKRKLKGVARDRSRPRGKPYVRPAQADIPARTAQIQTALERLSGRRVDSVEVSGLKRIGRDAALDKVSLKPGATLTPEGARNDIRALFAMGYFDDVDLRGEERSGGGVALRFVFKERPVISELEFEGNQQLSESDLKDVAKVKQWSILDFNKVQEDVRLLQKHYEDKGFFLAKVAFEVREVPGRPDEVRLVYKINDFDKIKIKKITFLNNRHYGDDKLKAVLQETTEGGLFSFLGSGGSYKEGAFKNDLQRLTYFYLDNGYVKFRYETPVVTVSEDKKSLFISIYVDEGEQYRIGSVDFSGDLLFPRPELAAEAKHATDEIFSITKRNLDIQRLTEKYQDLGYAFVNVVPKMDINDDTRRVNMDYAFEKGNLVYFGEILVVGNTKTHDKVIRRELFIHEGELYSGTKLRQSRENVERLGFFQPGEVVFNTVTPKGQPDRLNVEIGIKERSTGTITLGAGFGNAQGFFFTGQVQEINFLGRGQTISLAAQWSGQRFARSINLGLTEPYTFDTRWSSGIDAFYVIFPILDKYSTRRTGFNLRFGRPILPLTNYTNVFLTYKYEVLDVIDADASIRQEDIDADNGLLSSVVLSVIRDKRNNRFETTAGDYQSFSFETAGLGGEKRFLKWNVNSRYYTRLVGDLVFRNNLEFGMAYKAFGRPVPPSERFFLGGPNNLRGFNLFGVGPSRERIPTGFTTPVREPLGGTTQILAVGELEYPLIREAGLKAVTFVDSGNAFLGWPDAFTIRVNAGFGFRWFSPIGPLRFEWGFPLARRPGEDNVVFNFFIGPPF